MEIQESGLSTQNWTDKRLDCFVAHSVEARWRDDIVQVCKQVLPEFGLEPQFAADHYDPIQPLRKKVIDLIAHSRYGIYDLSYWRKDEGSEWEMPRNVFIELGIAIALNRPILLLRHAENREDSSLLPECLKSISSHILEFSGGPTLEEILRHHLSQWINAPPERDWWNRYCIFGDRVCEYREAHPLINNLRKGKLHCHVSDGCDVDRPDFRKVVKEVLVRFNDVTFEHLIEQPTNEGYDFRLCTYCQTVRSTPFAIYRITPHTSADTFIAIGMSLALEKQYPYEIPKILLTTNRRHVPSLLSDYEVVIAQNTKELTDSLRRFMPQVIDKIRKTRWKQQPLPFVEFVPRHIEKLATRDEEEAISPDNATLEEVDECPFCSAEIRHGAKFCNMCGSSLVLEDLPLQNVQTDPLLEQAHTLYTQKRLSEAEKVYTQALQLDNTNPLGWQGLGLTQGLLARHTEALTSFERALQLDPALVISWNGRGTALSTLQRNQEALSAFERALKLDPNNASSWNGKGAVLNALGRSKEALDAFDMALRFDPHMAQTWNNKGLVLRQQKRYQEALSAFDMALTYDKNIATSWSGKASVLHEMGRMQEALDCYQQACNCNPALVSAWNGKGAVLYDMGQYKQALQAFQEALKLDKNYAPACYGIGNVYYVQQKLKSALDMFERALRSDPNYAKAWNKRGNVLYDLNERVEALKSYDQALRIDARLASAWNGKAGVYAQLERYTDALHAYEKALEINPNFAQAWNGRGNTYYHLSNYNQALTSYERAVKLNPQMASAWHNLSLVLKKLKRNQEALDAAEHAIRLDPRDPDNWTRKAEALKSLRRSKDAREAERQAGKLRGLSTTKDEDDEIENDEPQQ